MDELYVFLETLNLVKYTKYISVKAGNHITRNIDEGDLASFGDFQNSDSYTNIGIFLKFDDIPQYFLGTYNMGTKTFTFFHDALKDTRFKGILRRIELKEKVKEFLNG